MTTYPTNIKKQDALNSQLEKVLNEYRLLIEQEKKGNNVNSSIIDNLRSNNKIMKEMVDVIQEEKLKTMIYIQISENEKLIIERENRDIRSPQEILNNIIIN